MRAIDENAVSTLYTLLRRLQIRSSRRVVRKTLMLHPNFPSLLSLSDVMGEWRLKNIGLQLDNIELLKDLPTPFIAHIRKEEGRYIVVTNVKDNTVTYIDSRDGKRTERISLFEKDWSGTVLIVEGTDGEDRSLINLLSWNNWTNKFSMSLVIIPLLLSLFWITLGGMHVVDKNYLLLIVKGVGVLIGVLLLDSQLRGVKERNSWFCGNKCNEVLNSQAAKIWGYLSWSELSVVYFLGSIFTSQLLFVYNTELISLIAWFSVLGCLYIPFSIYYQGFVLKKWCYLCLCTQIVLLLDGLLSIEHLSAIPSYTPLYSLLLIGFLISTVILFLIKSLLKYVIKNERNYYKLMRLKRDPELFEVMLMNQKKMLPIDEGMCLIALGNINAEHTITIVTNLYCDPCATIHRKLEKLIEQNAKIKANIVFMTDTDDSSVTQVAAYILTMSDKYIAVNALSSWYSQKEKNFNTWSAQYAHKYYLASPHNIVTRHREWCKKVGVQFTPTVFIDGYQLPRQYQLSDIKWLINCLPVQK